MRAMKRPVAPPERSAGLRAHPHQLAVSAQTLRVACAVQRRRSRRTVRHATPGGRLPPRVAVQNRRCRVHVALGGALPVEAGEHPHGDGGGPTPCGSRTAGGALSRERVRASPPRPHQAQSDTHTKRAGHGGAQREAVGRGGCSGY